MICIIFGDEIQFAQHSKMYHATYLNLKKDAQYMNNLVVNLVVLKAHISLIQFVLVFCIIVYFLSIIINCILRKDDILQSHF